METGWMDVKLVLRIESINKKFVSIISACCTRLMILKDVLYYICLYFLTAHIMMSGPTVLAGAPIPQSPTYTCCIKHKNKL